MINAESAQQAVSLTVEQALLQAIAHHQAGQLQDAERVYRAILQDQPTHPDANHNLGVLAVQVKQLATGLQHFRAALEANPSQGQYWLSYIDALIQDDQPDAALRLLEQGRQRGLQGEKVDALAARLTGGVPAKAQSNGARSACAFEDAFQTVEPGLQEITAVMAMFTAGRYKETAALAQALTVSYPLHGFGWKVLGAALKQMGQGADALPPMRRAAELAPGDAESQNNLGISLMDLGQLDGAELRFRMALEIKPDFADAYNNLGNLLKNMRRLSEAEGCYRLALEIKPDYAEVHNNLGNTLHELHRLDKAEASCRRALEIKPDYANAHNNLGNALRDQGWLEEAEASYLRALDSNPGYGRALCNLGHTYCDLDDMRQAAIAYQKALAVDPTHSGLDAAVYLAILCYLEGNLKQCRSKLIESQSVLGKLDFYHKTTRPYWIYLDKLLSWRKGSNQEGNQTLETLYVVGESHSLSAHGRVVRYNEQEMRCAAEWISGCKQWHLGNGKANRYKHKFEAVMARLPRSSSILLIIGEIDCRPDDGIIAARGKHPGRSLGELVRSTVDAYLGYVAAIAQRFGHRVIVGGVPCPKMALNELSAIEREQLVHLIGAVNERLRNRTMVVGMDFLDVHALTDRGDGIASGEWHIDDIHLLPSAVVAAFQRHCIHR